MNGRIIYDDIYVNPSDIYSIQGTNYQTFAPPMFLKEIYKVPVDYALLLQDYVTLDGTKSYYEA